MKGGASPSDIRDIQKYFRAGHAAEQIAQSMNLELKCVESFRPEALVELDKRVKAAEKADALEHKKKKDILKKAKAEVKAVSDKE